MAALVRRCSYSGLRTISYAGGSRIASSSSKLKFLISVFDKFRGKGLYLDEVDYFLQPSEVLPFHPSFIGNNGGCRFLSKVADAGLLVVSHPKSSSSGRLKTTKFLGSRVLYSISAEDRHQCFDAADKQNPPESTDVDEVARVCKIIEDLLTSDRNMEAVLDQCEVKLSHLLVLDVLSHFCHARKPAFRFFCWASRRPGFSHNSATSNAMMSILGKTRQFESMVELLEEMGKKELLTIDTFVISIRAFAAAKELKKAVAMFELMKKYNFEADVDTFNSLLDALGREKLAEEAQTLFEKMRARFPPNMQTYTALIAGWCKVKKLVDAGRVWNEMTDIGLKPDIVTHNIMLEGLLRGHCHSEANKLFELMKAKGPFPNVRSYTILIHNLTKRGKMEEAVRHFDKMLSSGFQPDPAVYTCLIVGFGNERQMDKVYGLLKEMKEKGCPPDGQTYNALIKMMTNQNMPDDAIRVYKTMVKSGFEPTIHTFNMLLKSFFRMRNCEMGHVVWNEMMKKGFCPDDNSYTVLIGGLISSGKSEEACKYLEEMMNKGMKAPQLDYDKFVADLSRAGKPNILSELARRMRSSGKFEDLNMFERWERMYTKDYNQGSLDSYRRQRF